MLHLGCLPLAGNLLSSCTLDTKEIHLKLLSVQQKKDGKSLSNQAYSVQSTNFKHHSLNQSPACRSGPHPKECRWGRCTHLEPPPDATASDMWETATRWLLENVSISLSSAVGRVCSLATVHSFIMLHPRHGVRNTGFEGLCVLAASHPAKRILTRPAPETHEASASMKKALAVHNKLALKSKPNRISKNFQKCSDYCSDCRL